MKSLGNALRKNYLLVLIIILASLLLFMGTIPGYPPIHTDEGISHSQGIAMILEKTLDPKYGYGVPYNYPIMVPLINAFFYLFIFIPLYVLGYLLLHIGEIGSLLSVVSSGQAGGIFEHNILGPNKINVVFWGRIVTAFFGIGVVFLVYFLGKKLFISKGLGLLAAFFTAINYRQVLNSHFGLPDIYNAFFLLLALYFVVWLWEKQTWPKLILAGFTSAVFFSTKFQFFALPPLAVVLIYLALEKRGWKKRTLFFINKKIFLMLGILVSTALILNIFHIFHWQQTLEQVGYSALKYRYGKSSLDFYALLYLYHIGIGPALSFMVMAGIVLGLIFRFKQMLLLLSVIVPFLWMFVYYTGGGFYTRNFVTIIPLLLITSAFGFWWLMKYLKKKFNPLMILTTFSLLALIVYQSLNQSVVVAWEYSQDWNYKIIQSKLGTLLSVNSIVFTDPTMVLPQKKINIIKAESVKDYLLKEMQDKGIEWVVLNTEWLNIHFLWWMSQDWTTSRKLGWKPDRLFFNTPLSKMIWELKSYVVFEALNPASAPDNNYLVIKIPPKHKFVGGKLVYEEDFSSEDKWKVTSDGFGAVDNFSWDKDLGYSKNGSLKISQSSGPIYSQRFISPKIAVVEGYFYKINALMRSSTKLNFADRDAFLGADFLSEKEEIIKTSLSARIGESEDWLNREVVTQAPEGAKYLQLYFQTGAFTSIFWLDDIKVWQSDNTSPQDKKTASPYIKSKFNPKEHLFLNSNGGM